MLKKSYVTTTVEASSNPSIIIDGAKSNVTTVAAPISSTSVNVKKGIILRCRSLGTGTYIAIGNATTQSMRMVKAGDSITIDFIDDISKIYAITDVGNTSAIEYIGA